MTDWQQIFKPGNTIRLTGTVNSYVDRYGETRHTLKRVVYDETSFQEIDFNQIPIDELIQDRNLIILNGEPVELSYHWTLDHEGKIVVRLASAPKDRYSVYDTNNKTIVYEGTEKECEFYIYYGRDVNAMALKNHIVLYDPDLEFKEKDCDWVALDRFNYGEKCNKDLESYAVKGDWYLVYDAYSNWDYETYYYYNPLKRKLFDKSVVWEIINKKDVDKRRAFVDEIQQLYNSLPAETQSPSPGQSPLYLKESDIRRMVMDCIKVISGLL